MQDKFPFTLDYQYMIIKLMLQDEGFAINCVLYLQPDYFGTTELYWMFKFISRYYTDYKTFPSVETVRNEILKFEDKQRVTYDQALKKVEEIECKDKGYIQSNLTGFVKRSILIKGASNMASAYNSGRDDDSYKAVESLQRELSDVSFDDDRTIRADSIWDVMHRTSVMMKDRLQLGIAPIDEALSMGVPKKQLTVFLGTTNCGKSLILVNCAINFAKQGRKVLYIDLENDDDELMLRLYSRYTGIPFNRFGRPRSILLPEEIKKIEEGVQFVNDNLRIKSWYDKATKVEQLWAYCERMKHKFDYDVCIVDYGQLLKTGYAYDKAYTEQGEAHKQLSLMGLSLGVSVVTVVQGTRQAQVKTQYSKRHQELLRMSDISDSFEICRKAALILTVTRTDHDEKNGTVKFLLEKQRRGDKGMAVVCHTDYSTMKILGPDVPCEIYRGGRNEDEEEDESEKFFKKKMG
jgi:replicative DNA helicase